NRTKRARKPLEQLAEGEAPELERLPSGDLRQDRHIYALDADGVEHEFLALLALMDATLGLLPVIGRHPVGDQEHPGAVIFDAVCTVAVLARAQQIEAAGDRVAERRRAVRLQCLGIPAIDGGE